ncbi:MAG TPA: HPr family phosphocarrier protein [Planctomycetota bacterium]|jgi:phosphotransferase system HPr-like phosphotransfer protein|nr:HPr family phosphocarrier protein [Planctomycetota bacterium]
MGVEQHEKQVQLRDRSAFHMRPCQQMVAISRAFPTCEIKLRYGSGVYSTSNILDLMDWAGAQVQDTSADAGKVTIQASGDDAFIAVEVLSQYLSLLGTKKP